MIHLQNLENRQKKSTPLGVRSPLGAIMEGDAGMGPAVGQTVLSGFPKEALATGCAHCENPFPSCEPHR